MLYLIVVVHLLSGCKVPKSTSQVSKNAKPNIIYNLADDLGYGELGVYGQQKIETPNNDALAHSGMMFDSIIQVHLSVHLLDTCY